MNPLVTIIIPNYNHSIFLNERLDSVFNQTYQDFEVILLDDASTDNSVEILDQYKNLPKVSHFIVNKENSGNPFKQWNKGIALAKGDYIWIAESDDFCDSTFLEDLLKPMQADSNVVLSYCQSSKVNNKGEVTGNWITHTSEFKPNVFKKDFVLEGNVFIDRYLIHKNVVPNVSAVLMRKHHLEKIMPLVFKPFMKYNADWFYYNLLICNAKVAFTQEPLNYFRHHEKSVIARSGLESGILKRYGMEFQMRHFVYKFLKSFKPKNINDITKQYKIGNEKLQYEIVKIYIEKKEYLGAVYRMFYSISIFKKVSLYIYRKFC